nr:cathepsin W-like isoform X2 [Geotrypetes seraphini]
MDSVTILYHLLQLSLISSSLQLCGVSTAQVMEEMFKDFMVKFNKSYQDKEELAWRFQIFTDNMEEARRLQAHELGTAKYGVTKFSDLTDKEFSKFHLNPGPIQALPSTRKANWDHWASLHQHQAFCDWRKRGVVSQVKNQGQCGSCWAFAAAANIESLWGIIGHPKNVSVQELIDCSKCADCSGGYTWDAFLTVLNRSGLMSEKDYPYVAKKKKCRKQKKPSEAWIHDFAMLLKNETYMANWVASSGPITVTINMPTLKHYNGGVARPRNGDCDPNTAHVVLIVGFGGKRIPYWILKNSWGRHWGEQGYLRLHRGSNACNINKYPVTAIVEKNAEQITSPCPY